MNGAEKGKPPGPGEPPVAAALSAAHLAETPRAGGTTPTSIYATTSGSPDKATRRPRRMV